MAFCGCEARLSGTDDGTAVVPRHVCRVIWDRYGKQAGVRPGGKRSVRQGESGGWPDRLG
jgi:hypothetical protein